MCRRDLSKYFGITITDGDVDPSIHCPSIPKPVSVLFFRINWVNKLINGKRVTRILLQVLGIPDVPRNTVLGTDGEDGVEIRERENRIRRNQRVSGKKRVEYRKRLRQGDGP